MALKGSLTNLRFDARGHIVAFQLVTTDDPWLAPYWYHFTWYNLKGEVLSTFDLTLAAWRAAGAKICRGLQSDARGHTVAFSQLRWELVGGSYSYVWYWFKIDGTPTAGGTYGGSAWNLRLDARGHVVQFQVSVGMETLWLNLNAA
jgi:hypothetical protein